MRLNPRIQTGIPALTQYKRDLSKCDPLPEPKQRWMCPSCDQQHIRVPIDITIYRCVCGWRGNREMLLCAEV